MGRAASPDPRQYVRIANDLPLNPKIARLNNPAAAWAYVASLCYCGSSLTDGHFPIAVVIRLAGVPKSTEKLLVSAGLWHLAGHDCKDCDQPEIGEAIVHDYLQHQRSAADAQQLANRRREAGKKGAKARWGESDSDSQPIASAMANAMTPAMANGWQSDGKAMAEERRGEERKERPTSARADVPDGFAEFWTAYPPRKNSSKSDARTAYAAALKKGADPAEIIAGAKLYAADRAGKDAQFTAHATTWLHGKRWEDALAAPVEPKPRAKFAWEN